jgi:hypothetical protein
VARVTFSDEVAPAVTDTSNVASQDTRAKYRSECGWRHLDEELRIVVWLHPVKRVRTTDGQDNARNRSQLMSRKEAYW